MTSTPSPRATSKGRLQEDDFIKFRLKQGVYGQRQPDVQMVRVKLPMGGVTPEQLDAFAEVIDKYVPLRKGHITTRQNIQMHHIPLPDAAKLIRELGDAGLSSREGCGNTMRNVTGDPRAGVLEDELFDITPYAGAYVRYFVRHPTTQAMPRKVKTAFTATDADNAITGIHDMAFIPRERDGVRGVEVRVGGGTSIMPRIAPTLYEFVELDNGDYLKVTEACMRIFDRQDFLRVNRARARIKVLIDKIGIDAFREQVEEELEGDWVAERDFSLDEILFEHDEEANAPRAGTRFDSPNGDRRDVRPLRRVKRGAPAPARLLDRRDQGRPRRPDPRAAARCGGRSCAATAGATPARPSIRTWCCAGCATNRSTRCGGALGELELGDAGADEISDGVSCPGTDSCKLGHHQLDGPQPGHPGADRRDGDRRPAHPPDPHQEQRLPERLRPAPHRRHRLLRCLDQGRRADGPRLHPPRRRRLRGRRRPLRPAAEGAAARQARARRPSSVGYASTSRIGPTARRSGRSSTGWRATSSSPA